MNIIQPSPVPIVTFRQVEAVLKNHEAISQLNEAVRTDPSMSDDERAAVAAAIGHALKMLEKAERDAGATEAVLTTANLGTAARLQSLIASGDGGALTGAALPSGGFEAKFDTKDWFGWARVAWEKLKHRTPHRMLRPTDAKCEKLDDPCRVALVGDWGTGLYGAPLIAASIRDDAHPFAMVMHLGDVYYSGTVNEVRDRFLNLWPTRPNTVNRALNSNHEMYSGGEAYFGNILPTFGQQGSYFAVQNDHWTLIGLDVAYQDHNIDDEQADWVKRVIEQAGGSRKVILFSHHQLYSHFEEQGSKLSGHPVFGEILRSGRIFAWYWGHEHRCTIFEGKDELFGIHARCIGHGGMPQSRTATRNLPQATEPQYARAEWRRSAARVKSANTLPSCVVLEGPNPHIPGEQDKFSPHGYCVLTFDKDTLREQMLSPIGVVLYDQVLT